MEKMLMEWIKQLNKAVNRDDEFSQGEIRAWIYAIDDLAKKLEIAVEVNPINGHMYVK